MESNKKKKKNPHLNQSEHKLGQNLVLVLYDRLNQLKVFFAKHQVKVGVGRLR